ncbi:MAG TPA: hypothetical protein VIV11_08625 [Kofleriaceae bacterium]
MRIACIHIPQFALQSATRVDPALRSTATGSGGAVAVVSGVEPGREAAGVLHAPIVLGCSRVAWMLGVRLGMTATAARSQSPEIQIVTADAANERETVRAIADALLGVSSVVDVGGRVGAGGAHLAMYAEVPAKTRGAAFGEKLLELVDELGLTARIGIADDRFTAWVAAAFGSVDANDRQRTASHGNDAVDRPRAAEPSGPAWAEHSVIAVPRGGSAAFLAPRPLSLLAISPEVQHMLEALGVRTLGEFAALPAPSISRPLDADYRALARGESDTMLRPYAPDAPIREEVTVSAGNVLELQDLLPAGQHAGGLSLAAAVALIARRIELRLAGRGRGAARLDITALDRNGAREVPVTLAHCLGEAEALGHVIATALESTSAEHASTHDEWRLRVVVAGEMIAGGDSAELFGDAVDASASIFAEGSAAYASTSIFAEGSRGYVPPESSSSASIYAVSAEGSQAQRSSLAREHAARRRSADHPGAESIDALSVVLSSSGSLFALSPPTLRAERRDAHRRTRRGKQRRTRPTPHVQPRLFDRTSSK